MNVQGNVAYVHGGEGGRRDAAVGDSKGKNLDKTTRMNTKSIKLKQETEMDTKKD